MMRFEFVERSAPGSRKNKGNREHLVRDGKLSDANDENGCNIIKTGNLDTSRVLTRESEKLDRQKNHKCGCDRKGQEDIEIPLWKG